MKGKRANKVGSRAICQSPIEKNLWSQRESFAKSAQEGLKIPQKSKQKKKHLGQREEAISANKVAKKLTLHKLVGGGKKSMNLG